MDGLRTSVRNQPSATTSDIVALIIEFLQFHNFAKTLQALEVEWKAAEAQGTNGAFPDAILATDLVDLMLQAFDEGRTEIFFDLWRQAVPASFLQYHDFTMKLEFGLQVHFALWPLITRQDQHDRLDTFKRMGNFKNYLETRGAVLVSHADFLPYYALPHVPEPESHPSFQHLLDPQCMAAQRSQLQAFLSALPDRCKRPHLYSLLATGASRGWSSRSPEGRPDPAALLTGQENLDSFIGKSPVNMSFEPYPAAVPAASEAVPTSAPALASAGVSSRCSPVPHLDLAEGNEERVSVSIAQSEVLETPAQDETGGAVTDADNGAPEPTAPSPNEDRPQTRSGSNAEEEAPAPVSDTAEQPAATASLAHEHPDPATDDASQLHQIERAVPSERDGRDAATPEPAAEPPQADEGIDNSPAFPSPDARARDRYSRSAYTPQQSEDAKQSGVNGSGHLAKAKDSCEGPFAEHSAVQGRLLRVHDGGPARRSITRTAQEQAQLPPIAWDLVKRHLASSDVALRAALLQAMRWRLIRSPVGKQRQMVLQILIDHDVFCCKSEGQADLITSLVRLNDPVLTTELLRLISVMASDHKGREYLLGPDSAVIQALFNILSTIPGTTVHRKEGDEVIDTEIHQLALAALQKLSLRRAAQEALVAVGMVPWIATYLRMHETLSEHAVEYSMAMLMNCCLCRSGRTACEGLDILGTLDGMVQAANPEVRTYVNGTIYSLLSRSHFKTLAHERGLPDMLTSVSDLSEPVFQNQISHILAHLHHPPEDDREPEWQGDASGAEDLGIDTMEYIDEYDDVHQAPVQGQLVGEALLQSYLAAPRQVREQQQMLRQSLPETGLPSINTAGASLRSSRQADAPFVRPMTPVHAPSRRAAAPPSALDSPLTMHTKAKKAARSVNSIASGAGNADEYVEVFGPRRELPRTPKLHSSSYR